MSQLYFFRHAQASYLSDNYDQLSEKGKQQSAILGQYLIEKKMHFDKVYVGPLQRQKHTFEIVAKQFDAHGLPIPTAIYLEELKEHSGTSAVVTAMPEMIQRSPTVRELVQQMQDDENLRNRNILMIFREFMDLWVNDEIQCPGTEDWQAFRTKVKRGLDHILDNTNKGETIGVFTSGGTISAIIGEALKMEDQQRIAALNFSVRNTSFTTFLYADQAFNLLSFNELPHLSGELITFV